MELTREYLQEALSLDESGEFTWKIRPRHHFTTDKACRDTNARRAGKHAGRIAGTGYRQIGIGRRIYYAHRLVWFWHHGTWPTGEIDHANQNRLDNRLENLRDATYSNNQANVRVRRTSTSGFRGVSRTKKKWRASICVRGIKAWLGSFRTPEEASAAYNEAHRIAFRDFSPISK